MTSKDKQGIAGSSVKSCQYDTSNNLFVDNEAGSSASGYSNDHHLDQLNNSSSSEGNEKPDLCPSDMEDNETGTAPIEMLSEFLSALMSRNYEAALNYCKIILQYEPTNKIVQEFYPLIEERLKQAKEGLLESKSDDDSSLDEEDSSVHSGSDSEVEFEDSNANSTFEDSNANSTSDDYSTADNGGWTSTINTDSDRKFLKRNFIRFPKVLASSVVTEKEEPDAANDNNSNPKTNTETTAEFGLADSCGNKLQALVL